VPKDIYLQPHAPDPILSDAIVLSLVQRHVGEARVVTRIDESGGEARTYTIDETIILKVQRPHRLRPRTSLEREVMFLNHLAAFPEIRVPRLLGYGREDSIEYTCMTRMPGVAVMQATLSPAARCAAINELGRMLRRIHQLDQQPLIQSGLFPTDRSSADIRTRLQGHVAEIIEKMEASGRAWPLDIPVEDVAARVLAALPETDECVTLHSNPGPSHTFVDRASGRFTGLIDFGDAYISHPALDLWRWRLPDERAAVFEGYTAEEQVSDAVLATWQVMGILADMAVIATEPERVGEAAGDLKRLLAAF
jgi:hygromycin-B 7''-O-kinase